MKQSISRSSPLKEGSDEIRKLATSTVRRILEEICPSGKIQWAITGMAVGASNIQEPPAVIFYPFFFQVWSFNGLFSCLLGFQGTKSINQYFGKGHILKGSDENEENQIVHEINEPKSDENKRTGEVDLDNFGPLETKEWKNWEIEEDKHKNNENIFALKEGKSRGEKRHLEGIQQYFSSSGNNSEENPLKRTKETKDKIEHESQVGVSFTETREKVVTKPQILELWSKAKSKEKVKEGPRYINSPQDYGAIDFSVFSQLPAEIQREIKPLLRNFKGK